MAQRHGELPPKYHVHHLDEDKTNNEPDNLTCISAGDHERYHIGKYYEAHKEEVREHLITLAIPASKEWHRSEEGHQWHIQHGIDVFGNLGTVKKTCEVCGKEYEVRKNQEGTSRFCSNNCKSMYRRRSGVDNIEMVCPCCGKTYMTNKYMSAKYCSKECRWKYNAEIRRLKKEGSNVC